MGEGIILFDGVCNFCNASINFVIRHDRKGYFHFAPLQSAVAAQLGQQYHFSPSALSSVVLVENGKAYTKSGAALHIAKRLPLPWKLAFIFIVVPPFIRDRVYGWIARNRYRWFGKQEACMVPTADVRSRFLL
ncbi:MAG TPA: thiol-disulfide oxidoreductase DCC family protein [Chitinophaga sp.]|uniref:thiol-disulfide oxidoreductase DCC family protein n=1 Tax=Chitinophaga sp. TaxID=1869181 RepID=UPI002C7B65E9|nr:thiol-disulfide oxidoreductase DCC family protein [Chitinophaga sp.]HVI43334.1 thiol-disulfide oxidoreductase DCC family protein [Chitinophaga sp.]